ncbi:Ig-like domain-containing protein, partial [Tepidimonas sp.]|uniref:Ig-like domain-containing protein n=1 Tax=Tepidimonas sp. TaxID=2002775 RepID=UPI002FE0CDF6
SNPSLTIASTFNPVVTVGTAAAYTFTVTGTDANGCTSQASVTVNTSQGPALVITPSAPTICVGSATTLVASGGTTYSWSPSTGLSATSGSTVVASPSASTTYTVTSANASGCQSVGQVTVTVNDPELVITPSATICAGATQTLTASGAGVGASYVWFPTTSLFTDLAATIPYTGGNASTVYSKPGSTITYFMQATTASGCSDVASTTVTVSTAPINTSTSTAQNFLFCTQGIDGSTGFPLTVNTTTSVTSMSWSYSTDGITYNPISSALTVSGITFTPSSSNTYTSNAVLTITGYGNSGYSGARYFRLTINGTCTFVYNIFITDTKSTSSTPAPVATKSTICSGNSTTLSVGNLASGTTVQWQTSSNNSTWSNFGSAINGPGTADITVSPTSNTYYRLLYNGGTGNCGSTTASTLITVASALTANTVTPSSTCTSGSGSVTLTGSAITSGIYQWQRSTTSSSTGFSDILGATSQDYTLPTNIVSTTTWFRRIASTSSCEQSTSTAVVVYAPIANNQIANGVTSYCSSAPSFTISGG